MLRDNAELRKPLLAQDDEENSSLSTVETKVDKPSAPPASLLIPSEPENKGNNGIKIKPNAVTYVPPDFVSFEDLQPNDWIRDADIQSNFIAWAEQQEMKENWIRKPNAETDIDLVRAVNGKLPNQDPARKLTVAASVTAASVFTLGGYVYQSTRNIGPNEIHFTDNAGAQEIRTAPGLNYLASTRHSWGPKHNANENFIKERNVTIVRILPGQIGLATENGKPIVLLPGRHAYNSALFQLEQKNIINANQAKIEFGGTLTIVRVQPNELGLAEENNQAVLLLPGLHIKNSMAFQFRSTVNIKGSKPLDQKEQKSQSPALSASFFEHGNITVVQVMNGQLGCAWVGRDPVLLNPGIHIKNNRAFKFEKWANMSEQRIEFGTIQLIQVKAFELGLAWDNGKPLILEPGLHPFNSPRFKFQEFKNTFDKRIEHGNFTRICVNTDEYGYAYDQGKAVELPPGIHKSEDPQFRFVRFEKKNNPVVQFCNLAHVIVRDNEARAVYRDGKLEVLQKGMHHFDTPFLTIEDQAISLKAKIHTMKDMHVTTHDRMPMHVTGQIVYRVKDAEKLILNLIPEEVKELDQTLEKRAHACLREQFGHVDLSMIAPDHTDHGEVKEDSRLLGNKSKTEGNDQRGILCTQVMTKLKTDAEKWGIEIMDFEILDVGCQKKEVEESLADATAKTRQAEAKFDLQRAENATNTARVKAEAEQQLLKERKLAEITQVHTEAERSAANLKIKQEAAAKAEAMQIEAEGNAKATERQAQAKAAARKIEAETEMELRAKNIEREARASAEARITKAEAEAKALLTEAKAKAEAAKLEAEGREAQNEVELKMLNNEGYLALKKGDLDVQKAGKIAQQATPAVVFQGDGSRSAAESLFFNQGTRLVKLGVGLQGNSQFGRPRRHSNPAVNGVGELQQQPQPQLQTMQGLRS